jgi:hypothetical protein
MNSLKINFVSIVIFVFLMTFFLISINEVSYPGLYYDEMLFVNAALGAHSDIFISKKIFGVPIYLMTYIGALKAWLWFPIFKCFGVSFLSVRLPAIFIGVVTLYLNYRVVKILFGLSAALIFIGMASVEPSTILHTRFDWGPTVLMMFFRASLLFSMLLWIREKKDKYMIYIAISAICGVFDKLNFVWIIFAAFVSFAVVYRDDFLIFSKRVLHSRFKLASLITILLLMFLMLNRLEISGEVGSLDFLGRLHYVYEMILQGSSGSGVYSFITGMPFLIWNYQLYVVSFLIFLSIVILILLRPGKNEIRSLAFIMVFLLTILVQLFFTNQATGPHHIATIVPFWLIFVSFGLSQLYEYKKGGLYLFFIMSSSSLLFLSSLLVSTYYVEGIKLNPRPRFDPSSYNLSSEVIKANVSRVVCVDWGVATVIQGLSQGKLEVLDYWPVFNDDLTKDKETFLSDSLLDGKTIFIVSAEKVETFPDARIHFMDFMKINSSKIKLYKVILGSNNQPLYEMYK